MVIGLLFVLLLLGHVLADSVFQPPWLSIRKRDSDPSTRRTALLIHGAVHALPVAMVTGSPALAVAELILHPLIDNLKSRGWYGLSVDQALHVLCKVVWLLIVIHY